MKKLLRATMLACVGAVLLPAAQAAIIGTGLFGNAPQILGFTGEEFSYSMEPVRHACLWWVPDAQGLKQLGLNVPGYQPVSLAEAAKALKVPEYLIYLGPALEVIPDKPLCAEPAGAPNFSVQDLP